jgi:hypothetical protein
MVIDGHYYSEKPPLFAAIGAIFYALMYYGWGATLAIEGCQPGTWCVYYWLTVLMVGVPSAFMAALFYRLAQRQSDSFAWAVGLTALLCFGTVVWPYSLVLNHHLPAAVALFSSFYLLVGVEPGHPRIFLAGLLVSSAIMFDLTAIFLATALFLIVVIYNQKYLLFFVGAALIPFVATLIFNTQITGSPLLAYFVREGYNYPGSSWDTTLGGQHPPDNVFLYSFRSLVGDHGLFAYSPLLLFALVGLGQAVIKKSDHLSTGQTQMKSALILSGIMGHFFFVLTQTDHFGGDAYGWRFFIPLVPTLFFFITFIVPARFYKPGGKWLAALWSLAALVSLFSAYQGVQATWHQISPPFFINILSDVPYVAVSTQLSLPDKEPIIQVEDRRVHNFELPFMAHRLEVNFNNEVLLLGYDLPTRRIKPGQSLDITLYWQLLRVVQRDYFVFTHLLDANQTRQGGLDRQLQEGYPVSFWYPGEIVVDQRQIPVEPKAANGLVWLRLGGYESVEGKFTPLPVVMADGKSGETSIAIGPVLIGTSSQVVNREHFAPEAPLTIKLGEPPLISLRGYDLAQAKNRLQLTLYWESLAETSTDWTTFVHLRNNLGETVIQKDGQTGNGLYPTSLWEPGEIIADKVILPTGNLSGSNYQLFVGLYDLATGTRLAISDNSANEILIPLIAP